MKNGKKRKVEKLIKNCKLYICLLNKKMEQNKVFNKLELREKLQSIGRIWKKQYKIKPCSKKERIDYSIKFYIEGIKKKTEKRRLIIINVNLFGISRAYR